MVKHEISLEAEEETSDKFVAEMEQLHERRVELRVDRLADDLQMLRAAEHRSVVPEIEHDPGRDGAEEQRHITKKASEFPLRKEQHSPENDDMHRRDLGEEEESPQNR